MAVRRLRATGGLSTDPTALDQPEALRLADNVLLHRPGYVQPRPGIGDTTGVTARTTTRRPIALHPYDGDVIVQSVVGGVYTLERIGSATTYGTLAPPDTAVRGVSGFAESRGSLYVASSEGIRKLTSKSATLANAGVRTDYTQPLTFIENSGSDRRAGSGVAELVAYRYCWVSRDANGYIRRSAPSTRWEETLSTSSVVSLDRIYLPSGIVAGDQLELYRTEGSGSASVSPGAEYYLAKTYTVTAADVSVGYIREWSIVDDVRDELLGAALYTSPSQGGILRANERPPLAVHLAWWADCMWYGNTQQRHVQSLEVVAVYDTANNDWDLDGLHYSSRTGNFSTGQPKIAAVSSVNGLKVGQYVTDNTASAGAGDPISAGTNVPALTKIANIDTTITLDNATLAAGDLLRLFGGRVEFEWHASLSTGNLITIGATTADSVTNLSNKLTTYNYGLDSLDVAISVVASSSTAVAIRETRHGHGIDASFTGTGQTASYEIATDKNALATNSSVTFYAADWVQINGIDFIATADQEGDFLTTLNARTPGDRPQLFGIDATAGVSEDNNDLASDAVVQLAHSVNAYETTAGDLGVRAYYDQQQSLPQSANLTELLLIRTTPDAGAITVSSNRPTAWRPGLQLEVSSAATRVRGRVYYSKPQEPEAVPLLQFFDVGRQDADVIALTALDDALLVWKEDGLYRVTGSAPDAWTVDRLSDHRLVASQCVCVLDDRCFAWTDRGVVMATEGGIVGVISGAIASTLREYQRALPVGDTGAKTGFWLTAHKRLGLVILGAAQSSASTQTVEQFVFHVATQRWSRWTRTDRAMAYDPASDRLVVSPGVDGWRVLFERSDEDAAASYHDASLSGISGTLDSTTELRVAAATFSPWTPAEGDVVRVTLGDGTAWRRVESVAVDGSDYVLTLDGVASSGSGFEWRQGYSCAIEYQAQHLPGAGSRWEEMHTVLGTTSSEYTSTWTMDVGARVGQSGSTAVVSPTVTPGGTSQVVRIGPSREMVRAHHCYPRIAVAHAGALWLLAELALHVSPQSRRVRR